MIKRTWLGFKGHRLTIDLRNKGGGNCLKILWTAFNISMELAGPKLLFLPGLAFYSMINQE